MATANATQQMLEGDDTRLLISESPYQFLPSLAQIFSDTGAVILQQLHFVSRNPYFEGERLKTRWFEGHFWIRIEGFMWWDDLEGICRHLPKRTFQRHQSILEAEKVLLVRDRLGRDRSDNANWYALNYAELKQREKAHREKFIERKQEREAQRLATKIESEGTEPWRPGAQPAEAKRHYGAGQAPLAMLPKMTRQNDVLQAPKQRPGKRHYGATQDAVMAPSTSRTRNRTEAIEKQQQQEGSNSNEDSDSQIVVVVESLDSKNGAVTDNETIATTPPKGAASGRIANTDEAGPRPGAIAAPGDAPGQTPPLPATAATLPDKTPAQRRAETIAARLVAYAAGHGRQLSEPAAAAIVAEWPYAALDDGECLALVTNRSTELKFENPVAGKALKTMRNSPGELRWRLCSWAGHDVSRDDYWAGKIPNRTGAFITRFEGNIDPPLNWLDGLLRRAGETQQAAQWQAQKKAAKAVRQSLSPAQLAALPVAVERAVRERHPGQHYGRNTPEWARVEVAVLNAPDLAARLAGNGRDEGRGMRDEGIPSPSAASSATAVSSNSGFAAPGDVLGALGMPSRLDIVISDLVRDLEDGVMTEAGLGAECAEVYPWMSESDRAHVCAQVATRYAQRRAA